MAYFWWILDGIAVLYPLAAFYNKIMRFWVQKGKNLKFSKFSTWLTSEALVALLCFLKGRKMFVSREELQTMILSTERPLCHVGELRYGPPKFFGGKPKIPENAFLPFESILCLYSPKWYSEAWIGLIWKHQTSLWVILGVFDRKKLILSPKLVKNTTEKGQNQENQDRPSSEPILLYKLPLVALSSTHMYTKMMVMGNRMGFLTKLPKNDPRITPKQKKTVVWPNRQSKAQ